MTQHKSSLGGGVFSIREVEYLESLPAVDRVRSGRIVYNDAFKRDCIRRYRNGESPAEIFRSSTMTPSSATASVGIATANRPPRSSVARASTPR